MKKLRASLLLLCLVLSMLVGVVVPVVAQTDNPPPATSSDSTLIATLLNVVVAIAAPVLATLFGYLVIMLVRWARSKMTKEQWAFAESVVRNFVMACEQYNLTGLLTQTGAEKKAWVENEVEKYLLSHKIQLDVDTLSHLIESAVLTEINQVKNDLKQMNDYSTPADPGPGNSL